MSLQQNPRSETTLIPAYLTFSLGYILKTSLKEFKINLGTWFKVGVLLFCFLATYNAFLQDRFFSFLSLLILSYPHKIPLTDHCLFDTALSFLGGLLYILVWSFLVVVGGRLILKNNKRLFYDAILWKTTFKAFLFILVIILIFWMAAFGLSMRGLVLEVVDSLVTQALTAPYYQIIAFILLLTGLVCGGIACFFLLLYLLGRFNFYPQALIINEKNPLFYSWKLTKGCVFRLYIGYILSTMGCILMWFCIALFPFLIHPHDIIPKWESYVLIGLFTLPDTFLFLFFASYSAVFFKVLKAMQEDALFKVATKESV